jgi:hypothetical protein
MDNNNQQSGYPLRPNLVPQKQPSKLKVGLSALTPKKKLWLGLGLFAVVVITSLIVYFALASGKRFYFEPSTGNWQPGSTHTISVYVQDEDNDFINGIEMQIDYTDIFSDENTQITAKYSDEFINNNYITGNPVIDLDNNTIIAKTKNSLQFDIETKGQAQHFLDIQVILPDPVLFNVFKLNFSNTGNVLYSGGVGNSFIPSLNNASFAIEVVENSAYFNPSAKSFVLGSTEIIDLMVDVSQDIVAVGAIINYDPDVLRVEVIDSPDFLITGSEIHDTDNGKYTLVRGAYGDGNVSGGTGVRGKAKVVSLRIFSLMAAAKTEITIDNLKVVEDDGQGTQQNITGGKGVYKITKYQQHDSELIISDLNYVCEYNNTSDNYDITFSWATNLKADSKIIADSKTVSDNNLKTNHNLIVEDVDEAGEYTITSAILGSDSKKYTVEDQFNCKIDVSYLRIKNLVVTPTDRTAEVYFMTIGGENAGNAIGELSKLNDQNLSIKDTISTTVHSLDLSNLEPNTEYELIVNATAGSDSDDKKVIFKTKPDKAQPSTNIVLKVERDRVCDSWLYCNSSVQVKNSKNKTENLCFDIGLCDRLDSSGNCISSVNLGDLGVTGGNQTFTPDQEDKFKNLSGYSKVGMKWDADTIIEGYKHYATMSQDGENVDIRNNNFELGDNWPWENHDYGLISVIEDIYQPSNHVLQIATDDKRAIANKVTARNNTYSGAKIPIYIPAGNNHFLSFDIRSSSDKKEILVGLQIGETFVPIDFKNNNYTATNLIIGKGFQRVIVPVGRGFTQGQDAELIFNQRWYWDFQPSFEEFKQPFYIDNVSLKPVLNVQEDNHIPRTCRLYPEADAPDCDYTSTKDGKQYQGWKGYCVESDPIDENMCLNWYPVDILKGETDVFGADPIAGYHDRAPLYYCLESNGGYPYYDKKIVGYYGGEANWIEEFDVSYLNILKDEINQIKIDGVQFDVNNNKYNDCNVIAVHEGDINDAQSLPKSSSNGSGALIFNQNNRQYWEDNFTGKYEKGGDTANVNKGIALRCSGKGADNDVLNMSARLYFNNDVLEKIEVKAQDPEGQDGHAKFYGIYITYLGERCNVIAQVVDPFGTNYAFAQNVKKGAWVNNNYLNYTYNQDYKPYGASVPPFNEEENIFSNQPETWQSPLYIMPADTMSGLQKPYQVRAGAPYSVANKDSGLNKICVAGKIGDPCNDSVNCNLDSGTCELSGNDYVCTNGSIFKKGYDSCYDDNDAQEICVGGVRDGELCNPDIPDMECYDTTKIGSCTGIASNGYCASGQKLVDFKVCTQGFVENLGKICNDDIECKIKDCDNQGNCEYHENISSFICSIPSACGAILGYDSDNKYVDLDTSSKFNSLCMVDWGICEASAAGAGPSDLRCMVPGICSEQGIIGKTQCVAGSSDKLGQECKNSYECGYPGGLCIGIDLTQDQQEQLVGGWQQGKENLSGLFARSLAVWHWDNQEKKYVKQCDYNNPGNYCWDKRAELGELPKVFNITVNNEKSDTDQKGRHSLTFKSTASIVLRFNADMNENQFPMTSYRVDWGDGEQSAISNLKIAPRLDSKNPHIMLHTYVCESNNNCEFTPKVQIQDNWGMCNGGDKATNNLCPINTVTWEPFDGEIIVKP